MKCDEVKELLSTMVDGEITKDEEVVLSAHLKECSTCSDKLKEERVLKMRVGKLYRDRRADNSFKEEVFKMINERTTTLPGVVVRQFPLPIFAGVGLALVLIFFFYIYFYPSYETKGFHGGLMTYAEETIEKIQRGVPAIEYPTSDPRLLEGYFKKHDEINFEVPVPDMRGAGYELIGGSVKKIKSIPVAISVYKSEKAIVLNIMCEGLEFEGKEFGEEHLDEKSGMEFYLSSHGKVNSVAWWMGEELCIAISPLPQEKLIEFIMAGG